VPDAAVGEPLRVIIGPTGAGKSALALALARERRLAVVSADSRQLYRGFDIGTAKPTAAERARVPHYGIDVAAPTERWSAHRWAEGAEAWLRDARRLGRTPVVVGGTGFYVRALVRPLADVPVLDAPRRDRLATWLAGRSFEELQRWCRRLDPARAHLGRAQLQRAIETALLAGVRLSAAFGAAPGGDGPARVATAQVAVRYLVVDPGPPLAGRIASRVAAMVAAGWVDEVRRLVRDVPADAPAWQASGYGAMRDHVEGRCALGAAIERVVVETRQYAKRQRTWIRHQLVEGPVRRLDPLHPRALDVARAWWDHPEAPEEA
jgi:tRNA dimethylallyltransferase